MGVSFCEAELDVISTSETRRNLDLVPLCFALKPKAQRNLAFVKSKSESKIPHPARGSGMTTIVFISLLALCVSAFPDTVFSSENSESFGGADTAANKKDVRPSDSFAANAVSGFGIEVNPQTGQPGVTITCIDLPGIVEEMDLNLNLSAGDTVSGDKSSVYGFPAGFKWDLDYVDAKNEILKLTGSASLIIDPSWRPSGLRFVKSAMFKMEKLSGAGAELTYDKRKYLYKLTMLDGSARYFDRFGRLICVDDRFGNRILFYYDRDDYIDNSKLVKINDSFGQDIGITYTGDRLVKTAEITLPDGRKAICSFNITPALSSNVTLVSPEGRRVVISLFENGRIREVQYPSGGSIRYDYNDNAVDYILAKGGKTRSFPAVSKVTEDSGHAGSAKKTTYYDYRSSGRFYTGYPDYPFGSDQLFTSGANAFKFSTSITSRRNPENGGNIKTLITFNNLNLPLRTEIRQGDSLKQTTIPKYAGQISHGIFPSLQQLGGNYSRAVETEVKTGSRTINNETLSYNPDGLVSLSIEKTGTATAETHKDYFNFALEKTSETRDSEDNTGMILSENTLDASGKYIAGSVAKRGGEKIVIQTAMDSHGRTTLMNTKKLDGAEPSTVSEKYSYLDPQTGGYELTTVAIDGLGHETSVTVDIRNGFVMKETNAMGRSIIYDYDKDKKGLLVTKKYPDGSWETIDETDPKKTVSTSSGYVETEYLDGFGRLIKRTDNGGPGSAERTLYACTYNELGEIATETDMFSRTTKHFYNDWQGRKTKTIENPYVPGASAYQGNETSIKYDDVNLIETLNYNGVNVSKTQYDDRDNVLKEINFLGGCPGKNVHPAKEFAYNGKGQEISSKLLMATDINLPGREVLSKTSKYDLEENEISSRVKTRDGALNTTQAYFNAFGYVNSSNIAYDKVSPGVDGSMKGFSSEVKEYNAAGDIIKVTNALNQSMFFTYDKNGNMTSMTDFAKKKTEYKYDVMDRLSSIESGDMEVIVKYYPPGSPAEGQVQSRELKTGKTLKDRIEYSYNSRGLLEKTTYFDGRSRHAEYDNYDRLISVTDINGIRTIITYDRNIPENISSIENNYGRIDYSYYPPETGGLLGSGTTLKQASFSNGVQISYDYYTHDPNSAAPTSLMLKSIKTTGSGGVLLSLISYEYDEMGRTSKVTRESPDKNDRQANNIRVFVYNDNNQLISDEMRSIDNAVFEKTAYVYDIRGNIVSRSVSKTGEASKTSYEYDADNKLISMTGPDGATTSYVYDRNGGLKTIMVNSKAVKSFDYNAFGQLTTYRDSTGADISYSYDAEGLRSLKKDNKSGYSIRYFYDADRKIVNEEDSKGRRSSTLANLLRVVDGRQQWLITDKKDVIACIDEKAAKTSEEYSFTAYGGESGTGPSVKGKAGDDGFFSISSNPYRYSGYYEDEESGMYYLKARLYSPELMRFTSRDSYDLTNRYAYADGNPVEIVDPDGQIGVLAVLAIVSLSAGVIGEGLNIAANKIEQRRPESGYRTIQNLRTSSRVFGGVSLVTGVSAAAGAGAKAYKAYRLERSRRVAMEQTRLQTQRVRQIDQARRDHIIAKGAKARDVNYTERQLRRHNERARQRFATKYGDNWMSQNQSRQQIRNQRQAIDFFRPRNPNRFESRRLTTIQERTQSNNRQQVQPNHQQLDNQQVIQNRELSMEEILDRAETEFNQWASQSGYKVKRR